MAGNLKNYCSVWQKVTSDRVLLDVIKNDLQDNFKERPGNTSAPKVSDTEQEIKIWNK